MEQAFNSEFYAKLRTLRMSIALTVAAKRLAGALSYIVLENGDRLFLEIMKDGSIENHRGLTGMQAFRKSIESLDRTEFDGGGDFLQSLKHGNFKKSGMSFLISDGYCDNFEEVIKYLRFCHQEVVFLHVLSPEEKDPAFEGTVQMVDCETGADIRMSMSGSVLRSYKKTYDGFIRNIETVCKKHSVIYIPISSDAGVDSLLYGSLSKLATNN